MPVWSRDIQYGAAAGFIVIVGIVAIQFGFSAKLVLALLAGVGVLFCASLFDGLPRAAMLGAGAVLLLLVVYDLVTTCDSACQQSRAAQRLAAKQQTPSGARQPVATECNVNRQDYHFALERPAQPFNPGGKCAPALWFSGHCIWVTSVGNDRPQGSYCSHGDGRVFNQAGDAVELPRDIDRARSADIPFDGSVGLWQPRYTGLFH